MIATRDGFGEMLHLESLMELNKLSIELDYLVEDTSESVKFKFIEYWKNIIKIVHKYENPVIVFGYVFIKLINHIRTRNKVF